MYFNVSSTDFKENKKEFINSTHIIFMMLNFPIRLLDYRSVGLAIGSPEQCCRLIKPKGLIRNLYNGKLTKENIKEIKDL